MSKNVTVNGVDYTGVSQVQLPTTAGGTALFKDVDEITVPSGTKNITVNGTYDVSAFASAEVNVPSEGGGGFEIDTAETLLCTVETEDVIGNILAAHPVRPKYQNEFLMLIIRGGNVSTNDTMTLRSVFLAINGTTVCAISNRAQSPLAPDEVKIFYANGAGTTNGNIGTISSAYTTIGADGTLSISNVWDFYVAAGNTISYYEIPLDITVPTIDTTLRISE